MSAWAPLVHAVLIVVGIVIGALLPILGWSVLTCEVEEPTS